MVTFSSELTLAVRLNSPDESTTFAKVRDSKAKQALRLLDCDLQILIPTLTPPLPFCELLKLTFHWSFGLERTTTALAFAFVGFVAATFAKEVVSQSAFLKQPRWCLQLPLRWHIFPHYFYGKVQEVCNCCPGPCRQPRRQLRCCIGLDSQVFCKFGLRFLQPLYGCPCQLCSVAIFLHRVVTEDDNHYRLSLPH